MHRPTRAPVPAALMLALCAGCAAEPSAGTVSGDDVSTLAGSDADAATAAVAMAVDVQAASDVASDAASDADPNSDPDTGATVHAQKPATTLHDLEARIRRLERHHRFSDAELEARRSARVDFAHQLDGTVPMTPTAALSGAAHERLLDLQARAWLLRRAHKYEPRTWQNSEQRDTALARFDRLHPTNQRSAPTGARHHVDALHADVFVLETFHSR